MSLIDHILKQDAIIFDTLTDRYGTQKATHRYYEQVRFRYITAIERGSYSEELSSVEAIIWFKPDTNAKESSIVYVDNKYWRVNKLIKARRLSGSNMLFIKGEVEAHPFTDELVS